MATALTLACGCGSVSRPPAPPQVVVPGVTGKSIVIGGFGPPSGGSGVQAAAAQAYFRFADARGGVYGRRVDYRYLNDHGNPALALSLAHQLVEQDAVFAVFNVSGTQANMRAAPYLNAARVPDIFPGSGCGCLNSPAAMPYTFGWPLSDVRVGKILGWYVTHALTGMRVGVVYSADPAGRDGASGLGHEVPSRQIVARLPVPPSGQDLSRQAGALKAAHAEVVAVFTGPVAATRLEEAFAAIRYRPRLVVAGAGAAGAPDGVITDGYLPAVGSPPRSAAGSWITLFRRIAARYLPRVPFGPDVVAGMSAAYMLTEALLRAGPAPARASLITALASLPQGPAAAPLAETAADHGGVTGAWVGVIRGGVLVPLTGVAITSATPSGLVTQVPAGQPAAPGSGLPPR